MTYQELDNLLGLTNLTDFTNQLTVNGCRGDALCILSDTRLLLVDDKWKYWGLNWSWNIWENITAAVKNIQYNLQDLWIKICSIWDFIWAAIGTGWKGWWDEIWEAIRRQYYNFSAAFFEFTRDPWGYLYRVIQNAVSPLISGIKSVGIDISYLASTLWNYLSGWISPLFESTKNIIVNWITTQINNVFNWVESAKNWIYNQVWLAIKTIQFLPGEMSITVSKLSDSAISQTQASTSSILKTIDFGLGGLADALLKGFSGLFSQFWDWFKGIISSAWNFVNKNFLMPFKAGSEEVMAWLWGLIQDAIKGITDIAQKMIPRAPEMGASMIWEGLGFLGMGAGVISLMMLGGGLAKRVSGADIPYLGAVIADFSGFKYITGAIMGGLVTAAYAQPLKYYYNALFQPYLPAWRDAFSAFSRNIIGDKTFKFFQKYSGIPDKYFSIYERLASDAVSPFLIRGMAEAEILDPTGIFEIVMDRGYSLEKSIYITGSLLWAANKTYRSNAEMTVKKNYAEGFITLDKFKSEISKIRSFTSKLVSYSTIDGQTYSGTVNVPLSQEALMVITAEWEYFFDSAKDKVDNYKALYGKEAITEDEFRSKLATVIAVSNRLEDIVSREKAKKFKKEEPDIGKDLRKELKSVLTACYKEGLITKAYLDKEVKDANKLVDEETLIFQRAEWEAYKDDMTDWQTIYETSLANGLIDESEFRRDLIDMGFRAEKVELLIKYDQAKKLGRIKK